MARSRNIKPGFFINDELGALEPLVRLLFAGLWCIADREGRLEDRPRKIKAEVLPYDDCDVDMLLQALADAKFILRYEAEGQKYIQVENFSKHQNPHKNEAPSTIPAPNKHSTSTIQVSEMHSTNRADSLNPHTDSFNPHTDSCESDTQAEKSSTEDDGAQDDEADEAGSSGKGDYTENFNSFWSIYPKKKEKAKAFRVWNTRLKEHILSDDLIKAATNYAEECSLQGREERFIKNASTFLGPDRPYEDYINWVKPPVQQARQNGTKVHQKNGPPGNYTNQRQYDMAALEKQLLARSREQVEELGKGGSYDTNTG